MFLHDDREIVLFVNVDANRRLTFIYNIYNIFEDMGNLYSLLFTLSLYKSTQYRLICVSKLAP